MARGWEIEVQRDGTCDVTLGGRAKTYDMDDVDEALRWVRRHGGKGLPVVIIEPDGYRRTVKA